MKTGIAYTCVSPLNRVGPALASRPSKQHWPGSLRLRAISFSRRSRKSKQARAPMRSIAGPSYPQL
jgi:hypothetical protein